MNWLRQLIVLVLATSALLYVSDVRADTVCTASMSDLDFVSVDPTGATNVTATIDYSCDTVAFLGRTHTTARMCFAIGTGSASGSNVNNRLMRNNDGDSLAFTITRDAAGTQNWGNNPASYLELVLEYPLSGFIVATGKGNGQATVYGRIPPQAGLAAGSYTSTFNDSRLTYRYADNVFYSPPNSCLNGGQAGNPQLFTFVARAQVPGSCTIQGATDLNFGTLMSTSTGLLEETSTITMSCTRRTAWQVGLDDGLHASGNTRRLHSSGAYIAYELNRTAGWDRWGDTLNSDTVSGTGSGTVQQLTVHGRITNQPLTQAGRYSDTIKVVVTY